MSAFTALNGASPKAETENHGPIDRQNLNNGTINVAVPGTSSDDRPTSAGLSPSGVDGSNIGRESWPTQGPDRPINGVAIDKDYVHKRKRSESIDGPHRDSRDSQTQERTPDNSITVQTDSREGFTTPHRDYRGFGDDRRDQDSWYSRQGRDDNRSTYESHHATTPAHAHADDQMSDSARRSGGHAESDYGNGSPEGDDRSMHMYSGTYSSEHRGDILQHDPKKRKRNFSNRTKTGCLTCRKRKKKCDEQKPECSNCIRGGFVCAGYPPQRGAGWPKLDNKASAIPLESKDPSYIPPGAYGMPQPSVYGPQSSKREPLPHYRGQAPLRIDPPQGRPLMTDDDRPTASTLPSASVASPENKLSSIPYTPANAFPTPVSANTQPLPFGDRMGKDYQRVPPLHELSRGDHGNQLPQITLLHPGGRTNSPTPHPTAPTSNPQVTAQLALTHGQYPQRRTQKEEMLSGRHFYPFDKELCLERERCAAACWRFNSLTTPPTNGVSPEERARLFLDILQPRDPVRVSPNEASPVTNMGRVGRHVAVETPFTCDYGYNISIGHHVVIGRNCTINDVCDVRIGDNCVIGPNVSIYTAGLPIDPKKRQGGQGPQFGRGITIEQDCWIGGGATILPGRTIGKGSTVGAGSIVTKDVPPFTVVAGNPARVLRGIAS